MEYTKEQIRAKITSDDKWAIRAILALYERQTMDEKAEGATKTTNGQGFSKFDAEFMSSLAEWYMNTGFLTEGQLSKAKPKLGKYAGQLYRIAQAKNDSV